MMQRQWSHAITYSELVTTADCMVVIISTNRQFRQRSYRYSPSHIRPILTGQQSESFANPSNREGVYIESEGPSSGRGGGGGEEMGESPPTPQLRSRRRIAQRTLKVHACPLECTWQNNDEKMREDFSRQPSRCVPASKLVPC